MKRLAFIAALFVALAAPVFAQFKGGIDLGAPGFNASKVASASLACSYTPVTTGTQGVAYTGATPSASGGTPAYTFSETGTLPGGLSINSSTGVISGTPTASGSFPSIQVKVTDSTSTVANCGTAFTLVISAPGYVGPGDITSGALAWYGLRGYSAAYSTGSNPAVDLVDQTGANPITINILSNGNLDVASVSAWVTAHSVSSINIVKLYDQSGNGRHGTASAGSIKLVLSVLGSLPSISNISGQFVSSATITQSVPFTVSAVARQPTQNNGNIDAIINSGSASFIYGFTGTSFSSGFSSMYSGSFATTAAASLNNFHAMQGLFNGSSSSNYIDGTLTSPLNPGSTGISGETIVVGGTGGFVLVGNIQEVGIWPGNVTANNSTMNSNQHTYWGF